MLFMYHFCNIQAPIPRSNIPATGSRRPYCLTRVDEAVEDLQEAEIKYGYNCSKRIAYLKKLDLDILVNSNAGDSQNRGRSQSANR
ncbi:unnamed protein product [Rotaria socialis]